MDAYADVWEEAWDPVFAEDEWLLPPGYEGAPRMGDVGPRWTPATPLRRDIDRRNALVEIDALMATMLGVTADELCTIYRTQFAVLHGYDQTSYIFDANGRIVPNPVLVAWPDLSQLRLGWCLWIVLVLVRAFWVCRVGH